MKTLHHIAVLGYRLHTCLDGSVFQHEHKSDLNNTAHYHKSNRRSANQNFVRMTRLQEAL